MLRILSLSSLFLTICMGLSAHTAIANPPNNQDAIVQVSGSVKSKQKLARDLLIELGISTKYDLSFWNSVDISYGTGTRTKFSEWLYRTLVKVAGWQYVEAKYIERLGANFSEQELKELLELAKQPLMKKFLKTELQAYEDTAEKRARLLFQAWDDYNAGKINFPPDLK